MSTFETVIVALISGVGASLVTTWLKNRFDRQNKLQEEIWQRESWFLDKQAQAAIDILEGLDSQLKALSSVLESAKATIQLTSSTFYFASQRPPDDQVKQIDVLIKDLVTKHLELRATQTSWFTSEAVRLSLWFPESMGLERRLAYLNAKFDTVREESRMRSVSLSVYPARVNVSEWPTEDAKLSLYETAQQAFRNKALADLQSEIRLFRQDLLKNLHRHPEYKNRDGYRAYSYVKSAKQSVKGWLERQLRR